MVWMSKLSEDSAFLSIMWLSFSKVRSAMETTSLELCQSDATFSFISPDRGDVAELPREVELL